MIGGDYYGGGPSLGPDSFYKDPQWTQDANWAETNPLLIDYWKRGGLVTLCLHAPNPQTGNSSWLNKHKDTINLTDVVTPGRPGYDAWMHQLDCVARGLQELEDEGVVVLFRPFHEMNGFWFWWGSMNTPAEFVMRRNSITCCGSTRQAPGATVWTSIPATNTWTWSVWTAMARPWLRFERTDIPNLSPWASRSG